jgi:eukaryotic-like serine/threonine-protein kinase
MLSGIHKISEYLIKLYGFGPSRQIPQKLTNTRRAPLTILTVWIRVDARPTHGSFIIVQGEPDRIMAIAAGTKLGPYEIEAALGAGGMGEVYRARDTRIDRTVAVKVLPSHLAGNEDLKQRFDREARAISSLNHPNICALYDVGHEGGVDYLVMEYLEGQELSKLLEKGPLPVTDVLKIAIQIADALDKAHRQGLVHRDLKPANIVLTKHGAKLLDFGLAKWQATDDQRALSGMTRTSSPLTGEGTIVGTFQYMSPEQLEGQEADARSDLFSLGVVLYEMVTGKRPFEGKSQASLIAAIMREDPRPLSALAPMTPPALERAVKQCLAKEPDDRWQTAGDLKRDLTWIVEGGSQVGVPAAVASRRRRRFHLGWALATANGVVAIALALWVFVKPAPPSSVVRFALSNPSDVRSMRWPVISPDGRTLAFQATDTLGRAMIWVRPLNALAAQPIPGTEAAGRPFWSPDSKYLAFVLNGQLKKVAAAGGPVQLVGETKGAFDGTWGKKGIVLLDGGFRDSIRQISVTGGSLTGATTLDRTAGEVYHAWPCFLPDGDHFLYLAASDSIQTQGSLTFTVKVGSLGSGESKRLFTSSSRVAYDPAGYILYALNGVLMALRFDEGKLEVQGEPAPVVENITRSFGAAGGPRAGFSVSDDGTLAYQPQDASTQSEVVWVDRSGHDLSRVGPPGSYRDLMVSPDGTRLACGAADQQMGTEDIWIHDFERDVSSRLTFDSKDDIWPVWSPDGARVAFASNRSGFFAVYWKSANGLGEDERVSTQDSLGHTGPYDWSKDGRTLAVQRIVSGQWDIGLTDVATRTTRWLLTTEFNEMAPAISPDGRFLAYSSNETGRNEVYVVELGDRAGKWQISSNMGAFPVWRADGHELFFLGRGGVLMAVPVTPGASLKVGTPEELFETRLEINGFRLRRYDVSADGQRFLLNRQMGDPAATGFVTVLNWSRELQETP